MTLDLFRTADPLPGLLVTIDGPNASGKTSIAEAVAARLADAGVTVHATRQPSASEIGKLARGSEAVIGGRALACLVAADRHHQLAHEIVPALEAGAAVVCDRYVESSLVLQRIDGVELEYVLAINSGLRRPDVRVRLEASKDVLVARLAARATVPGRRFEGMPGVTARELALYADADAVLGSQCGAPAAIVLDTSASAPDDQARRVTDVVLKRLREMH